MTRVYFVKTDSGLIGFGPHDNAFLRALESGESIEADVRKARNPAHHNKFFALLQRAVEGSNQYPSIKPLLIELKLRCDWYDEHVTASGQMVFVPRSISFANMDQTQFDPFYAKAVVVLAGMVPDNAQIVAEADEILARAPVREQEIASA